jgi:N6-adenosine-specific RNA methylase IME4
VRFERGAPVYCPVTQTTMLMASAGEHSAKPDLAYAEIEALCASPSRLELFARAERAGWVTSGAELPRKPTSRTEREAAELDAWRAELKNTPPPTAAPKRKKLQIEDRP